MIEHNKNKNYNENNNENNEKENNLNLDIKSKTEDSNPKEKKEDEILDGSAFSNYITINKAYLHNPKLIIDSPRTLEACQIEGITPLELQYK